VVWDLRLIGDPRGPTSITGTARFMTTTFYIVTNLLSGHTAESDDLGGFRRTDGRNAFLVCANLTGAGLDGADLTGAWLDRANLTGAQLGAESHMS
jgi:uncharacterized protein YjbI with pentapeptide repeats